MLLADELPGSLWGEAIIHMTWLKNHTSTHALLHKTPFEAATNKSPNLANIHEFGCKVYIYTSMHLQNSMQNQRSAIGLDLTAKVLVTEYTGLRVAMSVSNVTSVSHRRLMLVFHPRGRSYLPSRTNQNQKHKTHQLNPPPQTKPMNYSP
jgi:hypothetical protein